MAANTEFFEALSLLEHERGITAEYLIDKIQAAIVIAVKKNYEVEDDNVLVEIDPTSGKFNVSLVQDIVPDDEWVDEHTQVPESEAQNIRKTYQAGMRMVTPLKTRDFGRIAAQTAKHVIRQGIREAERSQQLSEIQSKAHDIVQATVTRVDPERGIVAVDLGKGGEAILPRNEQVPGEVYTEGQLLQVYIVDVVSGERGARVMISRTHPGLVKRLFELEVPEIFDGTVEVKAISREAGARTKMAVWSKDPNVNPVSACIGPHGDRVAAVVEKLGGEFLPQIAEGDILYMPSTLPGVSSSEAAAMLQKTDKLIRTVPEVATVFGKAGRADTATDSAPLEMIETTIQLKPESEWRPGMTMEKIIDELDKTVRLPGLANLWVMPIRNRIDMLSTGVKSPIGIKVSGQSLADIDGAAEQIEEAAKTVPGVVSAKSA